MLTSYLSANTLIATVNGNEITTSVAGSKFLNMRKELREINVHRLVDKELAIEFALNSDIVKSEKFQKNFDHVLKMSKQNLSSDEKTLKNVLKKGKTLNSEQLRSKKGLLAFDLLLDKKAHQLKPTDEELEIYYKNNFVKYNVPELYEISSIVVKDKKTADKILADIQKSSVKAKAFHDAAIKYSIAPNAKEGGYLGQYDITVMNKTMSNVIKKLKMGSYSKEAIETEFGYELVFLIGKTQAKKQSFKQAKVKVKNGFIQDKVLEWAYNKVEELRKEAKITIGSL